MSGVDVHDDVDLVTLAHLSGDLAVDLDDSRELDGSTCSVSGSSQLRNSARLNAECGATGTTNNPCVRGETIGPAGGERVRSRSGRG